MASTSVMVAGGGDEGGKVKGKSDHPAAEEASGMELLKPQVEEAVGQDVVSQEEADLEEASLVEEETTPVEEDITPAEAAEVEEAGKMEAGKMEVEAAADTQSAKAQEWDPLAVDVTTFSSAFSGLQLQELEGAFQRTQFPNVLVGKKLEIPEGVPEDPVEATEPENGSQ